MPTRSEVKHMYGEFVRAPYFCIVHSQLRAGHERFDQYQPDTLAELVFSVVDHLLPGRPELLKKMCELDAGDKARVAGRKRRYVAERRDELYEDGRTDLSAEEHRGFWFSTNAKKTQARQMVQLACRASEVPYSSIRERNGFRSDV